MLLLVTAAAQLVILFPINFFNSIAIHFLESFTNLSHQLNYQLFSCSTVFQPYGKRKPHNQINLGKKML